MGKTWTYGKDPHPKTWYETSQILKKPTKKPKVDNGKT